MWNNSISLSGFCGEPLATSAFISITRPLFSFTRTLVHARSGPRASSSGSTRHRTRKDDKLAKYLFEKEASATVTGPEGKTIKVNRKLDHDKFEKLKDAYYVARGWDVATGLPTRKKLESLDLKDVADSLDKDGLLPKVAV